MTVEAAIAHEVPGRIRLRIATQRGDQVFFEELRTRLGQCPGVEAVDVNPRTGSLLIHHDVGTEDVVEYARTHDLFSVAVSNGVPRTVPSRKALEAWQTLDTRLQEQSAGTWDLREVAFLLLTASGIIQTARRNVWPAGVSLLWYAAALLDRKHGSTINSAFTPP